MYTVYECFFCFLYVCAGMLQCEPTTVRDQMQIFRLFCHECQRIFHDRLINNEDKTYFNNILSEMASKHILRVLIQHIGTARK